MAEMQILQEQKSALHSTWNISLRTSGGRSEKKIKSPGNVAA
jgi:hypothetical protein